MKKFYAETNDGCYLIVTASDDASTAVWFNVNNRADAENTDCSNLIDMTADVMRNEYPEHSFNFDPNAAEFEKIEKI